MALNSVLLCGILARNENGTLTLFVPPKGCRTRISKDIVGNWETVDDMAATVEVPSDYFPELKPEDKPIPVRCMVSIVPSKSEDDYGCQIVCD